MKIIDCRNMACPVPVVTAKRALEEAGGEAVRVLVDPGAPRENVTRFATGRGYLVAEAEVEGGYALTITGAGTVRLRCRRKKGYRGGRSCSSPRTASVTDRKSSAGS